MSAGLLVLPGVGGGKVGLQLVLGAQGAVPSVADNRQRGMPSPVGAGREDEAVDAKRDVRGELAEQRKQLKELLDAGGSAVGGRQKGMHVGVAGCLAGSFAELRAGSDGQPVGCCEQAVGC